METAKKDLEKESFIKPCDMHENHEHQHGEYCGHKAIKHGNHVDYLHDGHLHRIHGTHVDECEGVDDSDMNGNKLS